MQLIISTSSSTDPAENLALEEWLLRQLPPGVMRLHFYRNRPCVIIGRNQNPWVECNFAELNACGAEFLRRTSGGGAVYHDLGNLCYGIMQPRQRHDTDANLRLISHVLEAAWGVNTTVTPRHGLECEGRKISGTAMLYTSAAVLHHGTLLLDSNLEHLQRCLTPAAPPDRGKAIASVRATVMNLNERVPGITFDQVVDAFARHAPECLKLPLPCPPSDAASPEALATPALSALLTTLRSREWQFERNGL